MPAKGSKDVRAAARKGYEDFMRKRGLTPGPDRRAGEELRDAVSNLLGDIDKVPKDVRPRLQKDLLSLLGKLL